MNRNHLAIFRAVAEAGTVSKGADLLMVSQPAVSAQISAFEKLLKIRLFDRLPRGVRLTQAGEVLLDYARRMDLLEADALRAIDDLTGIRRGRLAVGASRTIGAYRLPSLLGAFGKGHPQIELVVHIENTTEIHQLLLARTIEVGLTEGVVEHPDLVSRIFESDELIAVAPPGHPLTKRPTTAAQVCKQPLLFREVGSGTRVVLERALATRRLAPKPVMSLGSPEAIKRAVAAGLGLAFLSRLVVQDELTQKKLAKIQITDLKIVRPLHVVRLRNTAASPASLAFEALLHRA
jgi:DNA-binding transcriptional LysR family regulator